MNKKQKNIFDLGQELREQGIFFCFSGPVSQSLLRDILKDIDKKKELAEASRSTVNKICTMIIEQLQNIIHYSADNLDTDNPKERTSIGTITIGSDNQYYFVSCGNKIKNKHVDFIRKKLIKLQNMTKDEIKKYYIEQRNNGIQQEESKGAGLGFIELAKKSTKAIEFDLNEIDEDFSYFSITSFI